MSKFEVNLFVLGAKKCGTTSIHNYLSEHPKIYMSAPKEPLFFEAEYDKGLNYYQSKYFSNWQNEPIVGESRHRNLFLPYIPPRIETHFPNAKFIILIRDPVERAFSHWWHWYSRGVEKESFSKAIFNNMSILNSATNQDRVGDVDSYMHSLNFENGYSTIPSYIDSGYYAEQIARYSNRFGNDRIHIIIFEEFIRDPMNTMKVVFNFLDLKNIEYDNMENANEKLSLLGVSVTNKLQSIPFKTLIPVSIRKPFMNFLREKLGKYSISDYFNDETRQLLIDHYAPHKVEIERLLNRKLVEWQ